MSILLKQSKATQRLAQLWSASAHSPTNVLAMSSSADTHRQHYDVIIGGGGLVGTALACALAKTNVLKEKRILLLEGAPAFKGFTAGEYGNRVSAINKNSVKLFEQIGAWKRIQEVRVKAVKQMQVTDASSDAQIQFQHDHFAADVAYIIENDLMLDSFYKELENVKTAVIEVRNQARIKAVQLPRDTGADHSEVCLENGDLLTCDLLIGADGAKSLVREQMGVDVFSMNYDRMGLVATLHLKEAADNSVAWQRFIPTGPVAMLPLNDTMSSLVWSTTVSHAKQLAAMPEAEFVNAVNEALCKEFPKNDATVKLLEALNSFMGRNSAQQLRQYPPKVQGIVEKSRACFPLGFLHASSYVTAGAALIGDAAHRIHPLAGQGVNLGFSDVRYLIDALSEAAYAGAKLGDKHYLIKYEQKCLANNVPILIGVHGLHTLYSTTFSPVVFLRSLGLQLTENIPPIKNIFMKRAMG